MRQTHTQIWGWCALAAIACLGCNGDSGPATYPVTGTVTLDGNPVEGAAVSFQPDGGDGLAAVGVTDASGEFTLTTRRQGDGAVPGKYKVGVAKFEGGAGAEAATSSAPADTSKPSWDIADEYPEGYDEQAAGNQAPSKNLLPSRYANPSTSGFTAEVGTNAAENTFNFDLKGS